MEISLVIPAYNEERYIGPCLDAVATVRGHFKEVVVVDNNSTDNTSHIAGGYEFVRVVREERKGLTRARQTGLEACTGEYIAYVDADTRMDAAWVEKMHELITLYPDAVSWSGPAYYYDAPSRMWNVVLTLGWWLSAPLMYRAVGYMLYGANFVLRRSAIESIGGFDESVQFYGEDMTLAKELNSVGKTIFRMDFHIMGSARRFVREGYVNTNIRYILNFIWPVIFGKPYDQSYTDIR